jgi:hypothetical protein
MGQGSSAPNAATQAALSVGGASGHATAVATLDAMQTATMAASG